MSFSAVSRVFLKLPRLFLKLCWWVLVGMAVNCKVPGFHGGLGFNSKQHKIQQQLQSSKGGRKRRRMLLVAWVLVGALGSLWIFSNMNDNGVSQSKEKYHFKICREKARILQEHLNVSMNHSNPLAIVLSNFCNGKSPSAIDQKKYVEYVESMPLDRHSVMLEKQHRWTAEVMETPDQCPVQDGSILEKLGLLRFEDEYAIFSLSRDIVSSIMSFDIMSKKDENISQARASGNSKQQHQKKLPSLFLNVCWWVLVGMMANCKICGFHIKLGLILKKQQQQQQQQQKQQQWQQVQQQQQQHLQSSKGGGKWRRKLLVLWVLNGVIGSLWILWSMNNNIVSRRKETLANMCDERARMLQDQFNVSMNHVHALAILVSTFHHGKNPSAIDQKTFAEYTERTAFERPLTSGVAYALKVLHSEREKFEKQLGWTIKKMDTEDQSPVHDEYIPEKLDPSPVQDEYAPVILSQDTVSHIVSIDMMSGKEDRENILRARASGKGVLTSPFKLLKSNHLGVVLTFAVYKIDLPPNATPEERIEATEGYLGASFDVPSLVEKLLQQLASKQTIVVNVYDTTNSSAPINMYGPNVTDTGLKHLSNLDFGDPVRKHEMYCRFKQKSPLPWSAITASVGFLVIALLVGHIFHAAVNRIAKVEDDFREMKELKARAEAADVAKSQFLATVSHEIRTPMNGVLGMLQMLMDTDLDATQEDFARTAQASGKALIALINEVLDQAKIESGRLELEAVPFDVRSSLDNVLSLFSGKSQTKGIELAVYISDRVPEIVTGDPGRFRQIITNLVGNSIKFTEEGHIFVSVHLAEEVCGLQESSSEIPNQHSNLIVGRTKTLHDTLSGFSVVDRWKSWEGFKKLSNVTGTTDTISLLVTVEDTGVGIPQEAQGRIFMPFMQADSSTSRTYGGTGIGLSISKCLVNLMSGEMGFVSKPGVGSTFAFSAVFTRGQSDSQDMKRHQSESMPSEFRGMRGLVVDGRSVRADVTKYHLERLGMIVQISLDTRYELSCILEACNSSAMEHVDVVLVDKEGWGKGSGLGFPSLLKDLVQNGRLKPPQNLPKMFLLATSISSTELEEAKSAGYEVPVIMKPLRASMIAARLQQALGVGNKQQLDRQQPSTLQCLLNGKQILVVDDNVVNQRVAAGALKKYGANVTCAGSGKTALVYLQPPHKFDACFMDVQMPEMDGFEATKQIRLLENKVNEEIRSGEASKEMYGNIVHWHIPILAMTADVIQATHEQCVSCGMDDYVSKPFEEEKLYSAIAHFFQPRSNV